MSALSKSPAGVVLDEPMAKALLYVATQERLLDNDPTIGDGYVKQILDNPPTQQMVDGVLEQLVLGGKIFVPFWLPREWHGDLLDQQIVVPYDAFNEKDLIEVSDMTPELVLGMLSSRGIKWSEAELNAKFSSYIEAYQDWEAVAEGKSFDGYQIKKMMGRIFHQESTEYSPEQTAAFERLALTTVQFSLGVTYTPALAS